VSRVLLLAGFLAVQEEGKADPKELAALQEQVTQND